MTPTALSVNGLTKRYGDRTAVDDLDIELPSGVVAGFVGPNGAGKTTTMAMLLGLVRPTAGTAPCSARRSTDPAAYLPARRGADREPGVLPGALGRREPADVRHRRRPRHRDRSRRCSTTVGLDGRGDDRYRSYSLGMKQRLGIAAALLGDPELLILDEPANGLDPQGVREMRTLIGGLAGTGRTVLVSSHDLSELEQVCDWLVLIDTGRSLYQGPTRELLDGAAGGLAVVAAARRRPARRCTTLLVARGHRGRASTTTGSSSASTAHDVGDLAAVGQPGRVRRRDRARRAQPAPHDPRGPLPRRWCKEVHR